MRVIFFYDFHTWRNGITAMWHENLGLFAENPDFAFSVLKSEFLLFRCMYEIILCIVLRMYTLILRYFFFFVNYKWSCSKPNVYPDNIPHKRSL